MITNDSILGLGTAAIGRPQYINIKQGATQTLDLETFAKKGLNVIQEAYKLGIRYYDTAPGYGMAEKLLTQWVSNQKNNDLEIASKWGYTYTANYDPNATTHEVKEHTLKKLNEQWLTTLKLKPFLKYYQIHSATFDTGVLENKEVLNRLYELKEKEGIIIGLTSTGSNQKELVEKAAQIQVQGEKIFDLFQVTYNIFDQSLRQTIIDLSKEGNRFVIKEALANGRVFQNSNLSHYAAAFKHLELLAHKHQVGVDAIALRFCIDSIPSFKVLSGASVYEHLVGNLKSLDFELSTKELIPLHALAVEAQDYWNERKSLSWN